MTPLRRRMIEDMQVRNLAPLTRRRAYLQQVSRLPVISANRPNSWARAEIRAYQLYLAQEKATVGQFDLGRGVRPPLSLQSHPQADWSVDDGHPRLPASRSKLPVVLSQEEVGRFLDAVAST